MKVSSSKRIIQFLHLFIFFLAVFSLSLVIWNHTFVSGEQLSKEFYSFSHILVAVSPIGLGIAAWYLAFSMKKRQLFKLSWGILLYWLIAYFLKWTRNLNNPDFKANEIINNHFFQIDGFLVAGVLIIAALVIKVLINKFFKNSSIVSHFEKFSFNQGYIFILLILVMADRELIEVAKSTLEIFLDNSDFINYVQILIKNALIVQVLLALVIYLSYKGFQDFRQNKATFALSAITSLLLSLILNFGIQYGVKGDFNLLGKYVFPGATLYQLLFFFFIFQFIFLIINRFVLSAFLEILLVLIAIITNYVKFSMRSEPILVSDLVWLKEIDSLLGFISLKVIFILIVVIGITVISFILLNKKFFKNKIIEIVHFRILGILAVAVIMGINFFIFSREKEKTVQENIPVVSTLNNWSDITWMGFKTNSQFKSLAFVWTKQLTKNVMEKPQDYSKDTVEKIVKKYETEAISINKQRNSNITDQTVIYILSEGFSDPERISDVTLSQPIIENIKQIKEETTSGLMHSDGYGGGTANMEFQSLTGLPFYNYSDNVSTLYTEVVPKMKTIPTLSNYYNESERYVLHGSNSKNYNRLSVYKKMDFQHYIFSKGSNEKFSNAENKGINLSDETTYQNVLSRLNNKNQFFSVITMQNHAPWSIGDPEEIYGKGEGYSEQQNADLTSYARLMNITDNATQDFLTKLSNVDKKITVVFYGDHLPGLYPQKSFASDPDSQYETDYFIWSNYGNQKLNHPLVNSSDLTPELLEHTNSKVSPYYALLTKIMNQASVDKKNLTKKQKQLREELAIIQYDMTLGKNYISQYEDFFKLGE